MLQFISGQSTASLAIAAFLVTVAVMFLYRPFSQSEGGDAALYDYIAQSILRGQVPYRDVIDGKAPGSFYLSALAMGAGRTLGLSDVIAARLLYITMAGLLAAITFLVGEACLKNRTAGFIAGLLLSTSDDFSRWIVSGGQPKFPMIMFGMLTLLLIARDMPFWAGICSMCSCLCWQPGLLFTGTAVVIFSRYSTSWRDLRAGKVLAGSAIPLVIVLVYFYLIGALDDFWAWTVTFNYSIYAYQDSRTFGEALDHIASVALRIFGVDIVIAVFSVVGFVTFTISRLREKRRVGGIGKDPELYRDAVVIAPLAYSAFCLVKFNAGPYLIPFLPFIGIFTAWSVAGLWRRINSPALERWNRIVALLPAAALIAFAGAVLYRAGSSLRDGEITLQEQERRFAAVSSMLQPDDKLYVHGTTELLVLLNRANLNPYVFLDWGKDDFLAARQGKDFSAVLDQIEAQAPKLVALSRLRKVRHSNEMRAWVEKYYKQLGIPAYEEISVRRQD